MKNERVVLSICLAAGLLAASPVPSQAQRLRDTGQCVLRNTNAGRTLYDGDCRITQESTDYGVVMTIKMGEAQSFKFACDQQGRNCQYGRSKAQLRDRGNGSATFRWETFQLDVDADQPDSPPTSQALKLRDTGQCVLRNTNAGRTLYDGECRIQQESTRYGVVMTIKMGEAQSFKFACDQQGRNCQYGQSKAQLRDRGNGSATFRWETFQLDVDAD